MFHFFVNLCIVKVGGILMLEFYLVRHGQTLFNQKDLVQGACDSPLTKIGRKQAENLGKNMKDLHFDLCYSSPSERAMDTGNAIASVQGLEMHLDKRLKEMNFGDLEGDRNGALWSNHATTFEELIEIGWVDRGGENLEMVNQRIYSFFNDMVHQYDNKKILIASHGMYIMMALKTLNEDEKMAQVLANSQIENCSVSKLVYDEGHFKVVFVNDISYREEENI